MRTAIIVAAISAVSADALAQDFRVGGEIGIYHHDFGSGSITFLTEVIDLDITLADTVAIVAALPLVQAFFDADENPLVAVGQPEVDPRFQFGNPQVSAYYQISREQLRIRIGGGVALPAAGLPADLELAIAASTYAGASRMHGLLNLWHWMPETVPLMLPSFRLDGDLGVVTTDAAADIVVAVPIGDQGGEDVEVAVPLSIGAMVRLAMMGFGARLGAVFFPTASENRDKAQISLSPRITATFEPIELEARLTMNLDDPYGFAFEDDGFWGFFLGVHAAF